MKKQQKLTIITLWVNRFVGAFLLVMLFFLPAFLDWYSTIWVLKPIARMAITITFYCCASFIAISLWNMDSLLRAIRSGQVFIRANVRRIRRIQWCCALVSVICFPAAVIYLPLVMLVIIMAFLSMIVSVAACVMDGAVTLREENDLTV